MGAIIRPKKGFFFYDLACPLRPFTASIFLGFLQGRSGRAIHCKSSPGLLRYGRSVGFPFLSLPEESRALNK
jgi:hypothetical protein